MGKGLTDMMTHSNPTSRFSVGIDLGTSNSALFYLDSEDLTHTLHSFPIPQWVGPAQWGVSTVLPSYLHLLTDAEVTSQQYHRDGMETPSDFVVGMAARQQRQQRAGRVISSAKSWLAYHGIDPHLKTLPLSSLGEIPRFSAIEVTTYYLQHLIQRWNEHFAINHLEYQLIHQSVVITIPASFDEVSREYTLEAIQQAGFKQVVLLEEPQAAFILGWLQRLLMNGKIGPPKSRYW